MFCSHTHLQLHTFTIAYTHAHTRMHMHTHACTYVRVHTHVCMHVHIHMNTHACTHIHTCKHPSTHIQIIYSSSFKPESRPEESQCPRGRRHTDFPRCSRSPNLWQTGSVRTQVPWATFGKCQSRIMSSFGTGNRVSEKSHRIGGKLDNS